MLCYYVFWDLLRLGNVLFLFFVNAFLDLLMPFFLVVAFVNAFFALC